MESGAERAQGYRKEAERYAELASSGQRDITNFVHKRLAERFLAWPRIWSVSGVCELVGTYYTENSGPRREPSAIGFVRAGAALTSKRAPSPGPGWEQHAWALSAPRQAYRTPLAHHASALARAEHT
jgi:hypothetical protein